MHFIKVNRRPEESEKLTASWTIKLEPSDARALREMPEDLGEMFREDARDLVKLYAAMAEAWRSRTK